jgi:hypothetical protein
LKTEYGFTYYQVVLRRMEELVELIKSIDANPDIKEKYGFIPEHQHPDVYKASILADTLFINEKGECNWRNIDIMRYQYGYDVFAVEKDRFGWLIGGIQARKGTITFG